VHWFIIWSSLIAPSWSECLLFSFSGSTALPQSVSTFQRVLRSDVILVEDFANSIDILLVWQSFYSGINSHTSKIMSIQSLVVAMKSERCQFLKIKFLRSKIQHALFEIYSPLIVMYFENRNWPVVRLKWFFFMVLCIHFRLWFRVYLLMVYDEVTFCEFQKNKRLKSKLEDSSRKIVFFTPILSACIITSSLIHEAMTLIENSSSFEIAIYRFRLLTWSKRAFKST